MGKLICERLNEVKEVTAKLALIEHAMKRCMLQLVYRYPECEFCNAPARLLLNLSRIGWKFLCLACAYDRVGSFLLGEGKGYELLLERDYKRLCEQSKKFYANV